MATVHFAPGLKNNVLAPIIAAIDAGSGPGLINIYSGTMPATVTTAPTTQVLLATLTFSDPCGTITDGVLTMDVITQDASADETGTAAWARITDSDGNVVMDINASATGGSGALQMNTTSIVAGGPVLIKSFVTSVA